MNSHYTVVVKQDGDWWIGWIAEIPGVNCDAMRATLEAPALALRGPDGSPIIAVNGDWETDALAIGGLVLGFLAWGRRAQAPRSEGLGG